MKPDEIKRIEKELSVDLPTHYVRFLSNFEGLNSPEVDIRHFLYSSADSLIEINRMVGFHLNDKIIKNKLIIGDNGGGDLYLIDLVDKLDERVYVFDHEGTVENCFDKDEGTFDWDRFDKFDTVDSYRTSIQELFE